MVECTGLENRRAARSRGFESLSLRQSALQTESTGYAPCFFLFIVFDFPIAIFAA